MRRLAPFVLLGACASFAEGTTSDGGAPDGPAPGADAATDAPANRCTGALVCYDFEDGSAPSVDPAAVRAEHGIDETSAASPTHSFWVRTLAVDSGNATALVPTSANVPTGSFELSFAFRVESLATAPSPQVEVARVNLTSAYQIELLYDADLGGRIVVLERNGCKAGGSRYDSIAKPTVPFGLGRWSTVKLVVQSRAATVVDSGATATHVAEAFIDGDRFLTGFALCEPPVRTPGALRFGLQTNTSNSPSGWAFRFDDVVFFAR